ncbi:MAG: type II CAAX endopeptidase family protein [Candidatus Acidiferrum sp.]
MSDPTSLPSYDPLSPQPDPSIQQPRTPAEPSTLYKIFFGKDGLRAGWGLLIFVALMFAFLSGMTAFLKLTHLGPKPNPAQTEISPTFGFYAELLPFLITVIVTWIMSKIEQRPNGVYGLGGQRPLSYFFAGLAWGVTCLSLLIFTLWKTGLLVFDGRLLSSTAALHYALIWLFGFLMVGLLEEYLTRGYLLFTLTRGLAGIYSWLFKTPHSKALGFWTAAVILSVLFGLGHGKNPGESPIGLLSAGVASLVFCLSLWRTGSLWWAIGFHTSWDWAQSFLYGVADSGLMVQHHLLATHAVGKPIMSGGTTGPEGSVFVLPILAIVCLIIIFTLPRANYGDPTSA